MSDAIIGMFDSKEAAAAARQRLISEGFSADDIRMSSGDSTSSASTTIGSTHEDKGFWASIKEMFGADDDADSEYGYYTEGARRGGVVLTVDADESQVDRVADILRDSGAVNVDERASEWAQSGGSSTTAFAGANSASTERTGYSATGRAAGASDAASRIDVVKEDLQVGKRVVNRGGVRIVKRTIERPVENDVTLREERVSVDRRAADRPLQGSEANDAFKDQTFELNESSEEAVAQKTARVVGEVVVGKTATERTEKVRDTVRETDVQVEKLPGQDAGSTSSKTVESTGRTDTSRNTKTGV
jgi:uncharacterized protein (TIGR02271 family)